MINIAWLGRGSIIGITALVAACSGGGSGGGTGGGDGDTLDFTDFTISSGTFEVALPAGDDLADLTLAQQQLVSDFATLNEATDGSVPGSGAATYEGSALIGVNEFDTDFVSVISTDVTINADFVGGTVDGRFDDIVITDSSGFTSILASGEGIDITDGTISGDQYTATADGTVTNQGAQVVIDSTIEGAFSDTLTETFGIIDGTADTAGTGPETLFGIYVATQ